MSTGRQNGSVKLNQPGRETWTVREKGGVHAQELNKGGRKTEREGGVFAKVSDTMRVSTSLTEEQLMSHTHSWAETALFKSIFSFRGLRCYLIIRKYWACTLWPIRPEPRCVPHKLSCAAAWRSHAHHVFTLFYSFIFAGLFFHFGRKTPQSACCLIGWRVEENLSD